MARRLLLDRRPQVHPTAYVAPGAVLLGDVRVDEDASVWFNCVLRGDVNTIRVGKRSNLQDLTLCHGLIDTHEVIVGDDVTVGHCAIIHACTIEDECLIGMGAKVLSGAVVGAQSIVAAGAVIREGQRIPPRSLVVGMPATVKKELGEREVAMIRTYRDNYLSYKETYRTEADDIAAFLREFQAELGFLPR
jgi:carbonic anhydrase/acetyltransferase-like protein (isoleucine patch superfamily)